VLNTNPYKASCESLILTMASEVKNKGF